MAPTTPLDAYLARHPRVDGYWQLTDPEPHRAWENEHWRRRAREGRIHNDPTVARLPDVPADHPLAREWGERADTLNRVATHLSRLWRSLVILDVGCGCGWMSHQLAAVRGNFRVYGLDLDRRELKTACRVFIHQTRLRFMFGDAQTVDLPSGCADIIVLAATLEHVAEPGRLIDRCLNWLTPSGELHIVDSPIAGAGRPTPTGPAVPWEALRTYRPEVLFEPRAWANRLASWWWGEIPRTRHPWLKIVNKP